MTPVVVADASPLIALQQIGRLELLEALFGVIAIPTAVAEEISPSVPLQPWMTVQGLAQPMAPIVLRARLGRGERAALSLAIETRAPRLLVDERAARRIAEAPARDRDARRAPAARRRGEVDAIRPLVEALQQQGFWIAPSLVERVIAAAGEM